MNGRYAHAAHAFLLCTHHLTHARRTEETASVADRDLEELSTHIPSPRWLLQQWREVIEHLSPTGLRTRVRHTIHLPVVLVDLSQPRDPAGIVADLRLDLCPRGSGILYPTILMAFAQCDTQFQNAAQNAGGYLHAEGIWPADYDVRWQLTQRGDGSPVLDIAGDSLGAAFALGLAKLFAFERPPQWEELTKLRLQHLTLTASCTVEGKLDPVGYLEKKMEAVSSPPPLHWLIISDKQSDRHRYLASSEDERPLPTVSAEATLREAVQRLVIAQNPRDPFRRLMPFDVGDAAYFGGRDEEIETVLSRLGESPETLSQELSPKQRRQKRFTAIVGSSGSGKSSLAFAGVVPRLAPQRWISAACRPQLAPDSGSLAYTPRLLPAPQAEREGGGLTLAEHVATFLADAPGKQILLIIDQFEELFNGPTLAQQRLFLEQLARLVQTDTLRCAVLVTLRTDFLERLEAPIGRLLAEFSTEDFVVMLRRMTTMQLIDAMRTPVKAVGLRCETGLETRIAEDLQDAPGVLLALEIVLAALFEERDGLLLTHTAYDGMAKGQAAIAQYANGIIEDLIAAEAPRPRQQIETQLQDIFGTLVCNDDGMASKSTRYVAKPADLGEMNLPMVDILVNRGLLVKVPEGIQVAHEALIAHWPLMQQWVHAHKADISVTQQFQRWYKNPIAWTLFLLPILAGLGGLLTRPLFAHYLGLGTFLRPPVTVTTPIPDSLLAAGIHGFFGTWLGSLFCINLAAKVFFERPHARAKRTSARLSARLSIPGVLWGTFLGVLCLHDAPFAALGYAITGPCWGLGVAAGVYASDRWREPATTLAQALGRRCVGAGVGTLCMLLGSLCILSPVFHAVFPEVITMQYGMRRAWGEVFEQTVSVWVFLGCLYCYLRIVYTNIDLSPSKKLWLAMLPIRQKVARIRQSVARHLPTRPRTGW